jgi:hypothetical protein
MSTLALLSLSAPRLLCTALLLSPAAPAHSALFLSEYIEGSSSNKALEIYNSGPGEVDLSTVAIRVYANGSPTATASLGLTGTLSAAATFVVAHPSASAPLLAAAQLTSSVLNFNGDDAIGLLAGGVLVDSFGQAGVDPGDAWLSEATATRDQTLRRMEWVVLGDLDFTDPFVPTAEWSSFPMDTFDGLGSHAGGGSAVPVPTALVLFASSLGALALSTGVGRRPERSTARGGPGRSRP